MSSIHEDLEKLSVDQLYTFCGKDFLNLQCDPKSSKNTLVKLIETRMKKIGITTVPNKDIMKSKYKSITDKELEQALFLRDIVPKPATGLSKTALIQLLQSDTAAMKPNIIIADEEYDPDAEEDKSKMIIEDEEYEEYDPVEPQPISTKRMMVIEDNPKEIEGMSLSKMVVVDDDDSRKPLDEIEGVSIQDISKSRKQLFHPSEQPMPKKPRLRKKPKAKIAVAADDFSFKETERIFDPEELLMELSDTEFPVIEGATDNGTENTTDNTVYRIKRCLGLM